MTSSGSRVEDSFPPVSIRNEIYHDLYAGEIRLVTLLQGQWSHKLYCELHHASLVNQPNYKALSYAWGSPNVTRPILVNGIQHGVTVNLESALRRIRKTDEDLVVWIDALCINQSNNSERTEQVKLMHSIFASAKQVIAYLGEPPSHGTMATSQHISTSTTTFYCDDRDQDNLDIFQTRCLAKAPFRPLRDRSRMDYAFDVICFLCLLAKKVDLGPLPAFEPNSRRFIDSPYQRDIFEGLRQLMLCRWWNRIWVIQEVVVPKSVTIVYGSTVAPWDMFVAAANWESCNRHSSAPFSFPHEYSTVLSHFSRIVLDVEHMRTLWRDNKQSALLPLLRQFSGRKASDDRDKVFALLSLARDQTSIVPDYAMDVPTVFQSTVFDILKTTKSLAVLAGDLGRKDRQDLPSWVPDWSATYNDLDRRRANNVERYQASGTCKIYVQDEAAEELSGFRQHLGSSRGHYDKRTTKDMIIRFNEILGTENWAKFLPNEGDLKPDGETCLAAVEKFYTACGYAACLKNLGGGVIGVAGLEVDKVAVTGETAVSEDELLPILHSWGFLARTHFLDKTYDKTSDGLGLAFRRTLCADIIDSTRGPFKLYEHGEIATWFLQEVSPQGFPPTSPLATLWETLFKDLGQPGLYTSPKPVSIIIDTAIRSATLRRTFFITEKGYIGLGPVKTCPGDFLYILMGGHTPFILRKSETSKPIRAAHIERKAFEIIGDCYAHELMDGEMMSEWWQTFCNIGVDTALRDLSYWRQEAFQRWEESCKELCEWKAVSDKGFIVSGVRRCFHSDQLFDYQMLERSLQRMLELKVNEDDDEEAKSCTYSLLEWTHELLKWIRPFRSPLDLDLRQLAWLLKVAKLKMDQLEEAIVKAKREMDELAQQIVERESQTEKTHIYLV